MKTSSKRNVLALSHFNVGINRVFEDYCNGVAANADAYFYLDYIQEYLNCGRAQFEKKIESFVLENQITHIVIVWWSCDLTFNLDFLKRLARQARIIINFFDTEYFFEDVDRYYSQVADLVVLPDELARYRYQHLGVAAHTSFALFDHRAYTRKPTIERDIDVSFVGNLKQADRVELVAYLRANGVKVETFGVGSENGFVSFDQMVTVFNRSKINLNFTGTLNFDNFAVDLPKINQRIKQSKGRPIEIALCGGFVLSQYAPGIECMFTPGSEFDIFRSKSELLGKVLTYLSEDKRREEMALRAHEKALQTYDASMGFKIIFDQLEHCQRIAEPLIYKDCRFLANYASFRFFYIALFVLRGRFGAALEELGVVVATRRIHFSTAFYFLIRGVLHYLRENPRIERSVKRVRNLIPLRLKY